MTRVAQPAKIAFFALALEKRRTDMALNKKQKKQLEVHRQKIAKLRQQLAGAKQQMDDPEDVIRLEKEISEHEQAIEKLKAE